MPRSRRKASSTALAPGEDSISRNTVTPRVINGQTTLVLDWSIRLYDGRLVEKRTQGPTTLEVRRRAKAKAAALLGTTSPADAQRLAEADAELSRLKHLTAQVVALSPEQRATLHAWVGEDAGW